MHSATVNFKAAIQSAISGQGNYLGPTKSRGAVSRLHAGKEKQFSENQTKSTVSYSHVWPAASNE